MTTNPITPEEITTFTQNLNNLHIDGDHVVKQFDSLVATSGVAFVYMVTTDNTASLATHYDGTNAQIAMFLREAADRIDPKGA